MTTFGDCFLDFFRRFFFHGLSDGLFCRRMQDAILRDCRRNVDDEHELQEGEQDCAFEGKLSRQVCPYGGGGTDQTRHDYGYAVGNKEKSDKSDAEYSQRERETKYEYGRICGYLHEFYDHREFGGLQGDPFFQQQVNCKCQCKQPGEQSESQNGKQ